MAQLALVVVNGFVWGWIVALLALGLNLIFGLTHVINIAHGAFYMLGAVVAWYVVEATGQFWLALAVAPLAVGLLGLGVERCVLRRVEGNPVITIVATFGVMLILEHTVLLTFGGASQRIAAPVTARFPLLGIRYPAFRLVVMGFSVLAVAGVAALLQRTAVGLWMRAASQNPEAALALGVPVERVYFLTFGLGSALAGLGGVLAAPIVSVNFLMGLDVLILAFIVVIVGGLGNLPGSVFAAVLITEVEGIASLYVDPTSARVLSLVIMVGVILWRPHGLLQRAA